MKPRSLMIGAIIACLLAGAGHGQTNAGFPQLPPIPQTGHLQPNPGAKKFKFIVAGDNRPAKSTAKQPKTLSQIFNDAQKFKPVFFLWCGDTISGHVVDRPLIKKEYEEFFRIAKQGKAPVFNAPGNHEMDTVGKTSGTTIETPNPQLRALYTEFMRLPPNAPPYGAFNYGNSRFIALDTEEVVPVDVERSPGPTVGSGTKLDPGFVSPQQIALLKQDLEANKDKAHIFVFMHHPIKPQKAAFGLNKTNAEELEKLFSGYPNVSYVLAAHEHLYYNASGNNALEPPERQDPSTQGPFYLVTGGAGAPLDKCSDKAASDCGSFHHYLVFEVDDGTVRVQIIKVPSVTGHSMPQAALNEDV